MAPGSAGISKRMQRWRLKTEERCSDFDTSGLNMECSRAGDLSRDEAQTVSGSSELARALGRKPRRPSWKAQHVRRWTLGSLVDGDGTEHGGRF